MLLSQISPSIARSSTPPVRVQPPIYLEKLRLLKRAHSLPQMASYCQTSAKPNAMELLSRWRTIFYYMGQFGSGFQDYELACAGTSKEIDAYAAQDLNPFMLYQAQLLPARAESLALLQKDIGACLNNHPHIDHISFHNTLNRCFPRSLRDNRTYLKTCDHALARQLDVVFVSTGLDKVFERWGPLLDWLESDIQRYFNSEPFEDDYIDGKIAICTRDIDRNNKFIAPLDAQIKLALENQQGEQSKLQSLCSLLTQHLDNKDSLSDSDNLVLQSHPAVLAQQLRLIRAYDIHTQAYLNRFRTTASNLADDRLERSRRYQTHLQGMDLDQLRLMLRRSVIGLSPIANRPT